MRLKGKTPGAATTPSSLKRILRHSTHPSFRTVYVKPVLTVKEKPDRVERLAHALETEYQFSSFTPVQVPDPTSAPSRITFNSFENATLCIIMQEVAQNKFEPTYSSRTQVAMAEVAKKVPSNAFQIGFDSASCGLNTTSSQSVK